MFYFLWGCEYFNRCRAVKQVVLDTDCIYAIMTDSNAEWLNLNDLKLQRWWGLTGLSSGKGNNQFIHKTNIHKYAIHTNACMHEVTHINMQAHATLTLTHRHEVFTFKAHKIYLHDKYKKPTQSILMFSPCSLLVVGWLQPLLFLNMGSFYSKDNQKYSISQ